MSGNDKAPLGEAGSEQLLAELHTQMSNMQQLAFKLCKMHGDLYCIQEELTKSYGELSAIRMQLIPGLTVRATEASLDGSGHMTAKAYFTAD